jgi:hypothetical protein
VRFLADRPVGHRAGREAPAIDSIGSTSSIGAGAIAGSTSAAAQLARLRLWSSTSLVYS